MKDTKELLQEDNKVVNNKMENLEGDSNDRGEWIS